MRALTPGVTRYLPLPGQGLVLDADALVLRVDISAEGGYIHTGHGDGKRRTLAWSFLFLWPSSRLARQ